MRLPRVNAGASGVRGARTDEEDGAAPPRERGGFRSAGVCAGA